MKTWVVVLLTTAATSLAVLSLLKLGVSMGKLEQSVYHYTEMQKVHQKVEMYDQFKLMLDGCEEKHQAPCIITAIKVNVKDETE